ncbi:MAG: NAD(P)-dependent oxidoreductase, partial [Ruthenibacterium sp.]
MKNILITGGTGFVGRNLSEAFHDRYRVFAPRHAELELLDAAALSAFVRNNKIDVIVHAAIHVPRFNGGEKEFFNDMQMFANLEKISHSVEKLIYFGSGAEFDKRFDIEMVREEQLGRTIPVTEYGLAKYTMNLLARRSENIYNLRLFGIFGKYELWEIKLLSNLCCKAVFDLPLTVRRNCKFDFLSVEDLPAIVAWFIENEPQHHDYNVCMGKEYWLTDLADQVRDSSG